MSVPRNNLDDALRRTASNPACVLSRILPSTSAPLKSTKSKFKPAIPTPDPVLTPVASSRKQPITGLSSFSTPGFSTSSSSTFALHQSKAPHERRAIAVPSSDLTPSSSGNGIKRTSSDPSVTSDPSPQLQKRLKHASVDEKENMPNASGKEKGKAHAAVNNGKSVHFVAGDDEPWTKMPLDNIQDPWAKLDRDHPLPSSTSAIATVSQKPQGLLSKSLEELQNLRVANLDHLRWLASEIRQHDSGQIKDVETLKRHSVEVDERINELELAIKAIRTREQGSIKQQLFHPLDEMHRSSLVLRTEQPRTPSFAVVSESSMSRNEEGYASTSTLQKSSVSFHEEPMVESDDDYWDGMEDIPAINTHLDEPEPKRTTTSATSVVAAEPMSNCVDLTSTPYYSEVSIQLRKVFHLRSFRPNQLEAIIATLEGHDVFVLMPTGGGKSLCYQLPAICRSGKTKGLTVVVSPLVALMNDQVDALLKKNIKAFLWNSETSQEDVQRHIYSGNFDISLLYVTPEKLDLSPALGNLLSKLYKEYELARFVIDEAHCISIWGQDFRGSYQNLGKLRDTYPLVPIMALTATANRVTADDIVKQLKLEEPRVLTQSFNRPNLRYFIMEKKKTIMNDISAYIQSGHSNDAGVIYCLGRDTCEKVAEQLRQKGLRAAHFHGRMTPEEKSTALVDWQNGKVPIVVATIAFGMGIDKADVRFVIHYNLARSMSGYYQETGRAGRDGKPADCILFYSYNDFKTIARMIKDNKDREEPMTPEATARQIDAAQEVVKYCQNKSVCRRVQLLQFFGETFNKKGCARGCDNCRDDSETLLEDVTFAARNAVSIIQALNSGRENVTLNQLQHILRGGNVQEVRNKGFDKHPLFASSKDMPRELLEQMTRHLLTINVLEEVSVRNGSGYHNEYIQLGSHGAAFVENREELQLEWRPTKSSKKVNKQPSSNSKATSSAQSSKGKMRATVLDEDPIELYEDDSLPYASDSDNGIIEITGRPAMSSTRNNAVHTTIALAATTAPAYKNTEKTQAPSDPERILFQRMQLLRNEIMKQEKLKDEEDVLNDNILHCLSVTCPQDYSGLKNSLKMVFDDFTDDGSDGMSQVHIKHKRYGQRFLDLCIQHKRNQSGAIKEITPSSNAPELRSRFEYQGPVGLTKPVASVRKSKFKPAGV